MIRILIADDEISIIQLIKRLINPELEYEIVGETTDGMSALALIEEVCPDIVITDIRMPGLSGIELLSKAREKGIGAEFIIVSGYQDFQYAQSAIQYGAAAYLLKPIKADELNESLRQAKKKQGENQKLKNRIADMEYTIAKNRSMRRKQLLALWSDRQQYPDKLDLQKQKEEILSVYQFPENSCLGLLILKIDMEEPADKKFIEENLEVLSEKYCRCIEENCWDLETFCRDSRCYLLFCLEKKRYSALIKELDGLTRDRPSQYHMYQVTAAMGEAVETADEISYMFLSAEYALMQRLSIGTGKLIRYHKTENLSKETGLSAEEKQKIDRVLYERKPSKLEEVFQRLYREALGKYRQDPFLIRQFLEAAMDYGSSCLKNYMGDKGAVSEDLEDIVYKMDTCSSNDEMFVVCQDYMVHLAEWVQKRQKDGISRPIKSMKAYIREHYGENISLEEIVAYAELSYAYGSSIFKKETGMTITAYLTHVRMEEAQRLIRETNLTINEISGKVGYMDARYFSKLFIKTVGVKPVDYRKFYS